jgi:hypothetical protein
VRRLVHGHRESLTMVRGGWLLTPPPPNVGVAGEQ